MTVGSGGRSPKPTSVRRGSREGYRCATSEQRPHAGLSSGAARRYAPRPMISDVTDARRARGTDGVVAGRVIEVNRHPAADLIRIAIVDIGAEKLQVVFGGLDVVRAGDTVPVAPPGSRVPARRKRMRTRKFRGQTSQGMFCSVRELGWAYECPDEVALLRRDMQPGAPLDDIKPEDRPALVVNKPVPGEKITWVSSIEVLAVIPPASTASVPIVSAPSG